MVLGYAITGCAASGTKWASEVMTRLGSPCAHEAVHGHEPTLPEGFEGNSEWLQIPDLDGSIPVVMLIRDPLRVVRSLMSMRFGRDPEWWAAKFAAEHLPAMDEAADPLGRVLHYVAQWDQLTTHATAYARIEQIDAAGLEMMFIHLTGRPVSRERCAEVLTEVGTKVNSHRGHRADITWPDIYNHPDGAAVVAKAERWGYL